MYFHLSGWSFGTAHPIHQCENNSFPAGRSGLSIRFISRKTIAFVLLCWSFGVVHPIPQHENNCFCAGRGCPPDSPAGKKVLSRWPYGAVHPIHQHEKNCICAGHTGLSTRFTSVKTIPFLLAVRGCPPDSPAGKQLLSCWPYGAVHPIH